MGTVVHVDVVTEARDADLRLGNVDSEDGLAMAVEDALAVPRAELVFDLRVSRPPRVPVPLAVEIALAGMARSSVALRCLVKSEMAADAVRARVHPPERQSSSFRVGAIDVDVFIGDIVAARAEAVVNASNAMLNLGAGVSGALKRACDPGLQAEMSARAPIAPGGLAVTGAHGLPGASRMLHVATASGGEDIVRRALRNVLVYARDHAVRTVAVPAIGMGTGHLAPEKGARIFAEEIAAHAEAGATMPARVRVVLWTAKEYEAFRAVFSADPRFVPELSDLTKVDSR
jgi:O-acetyl-ADP-ribose deacetylase (regulator of RNase III)